MLSLKSRIFLSKKIIKNNKKIKIANYDKYLKSSSTIELIKFFKERNRRAKFYFIMGGDNLIKFHKWNRWNSFQNLCDIVVFPRQGYLSKVLTCKAYNSLKKDRLIFLNSKISNISSSKIRKNYLL